MREDKECPFSGVTNDGRVWKEVPGKARLGVWTERSGGLGSCSENNYLSPQKLMVGILLSLAGAAASIIFVATNTCLSRQNTSLSRQAYLCRDKHICRDKNDTCGSPANDSKMPTINFCGDK